MLLLLWALGLLEGTGAGGGIVVSQAPIMPNVQMGPQLTPRVTFTPRGR